MNVSASTTSSSPIAGPRRLGGDGPFVSALGVGTWALGGPCAFDEPDSQIMLRNAIVWGARTI